MSGKICFIQLEEYVTGRIFLWKEIIHFDVRRVFKNDLGFICFKSKTWNTWDLETSSFYVLLSFRSVPLLLPVLWAHTSLWSPCQNTVYGPNTLFLAPVLITNHETQVSCFTPLQGHSISTCYSLDPFYIGYKCHKLYWFFNCFTFSSFELRETSKFRKTTINTSTLKYHSTLQIWGCAKYSVNI